ncbi:AAA family ATPase [Geothrix oryzae]|nr:AAA family ATPase [Geothrix oryzae]
MRRLLEALSPQVMAPPPLAELLSSEGRLQDAMARQLLDHLASNFSRGRFHVSGGPGSGKSLLARQVARLWASEGRQVLLVAFNKALTYATQGMLDDLEKAGRANVFTYHDLAVTLLSAAERLPVCENESVFFNEQLPCDLNALLQTPEALPQRWDALVVDEAQDLDPEWVRPCWDSSAIRRGTPCCCWRIPPRACTGMRATTLGSPGVWI